MGSDVGEGLSTQVNGCATGTVACIDVRIAGDGDRDRNDTLHRTVLARALALLQGVVRPDDRICPIGSSRVAIAFGPVASKVQPQALGSRLAHAVGGELPIDGAGPCLAVSVGMATPGNEADLSTLVRRALSAARIGSVGLVGGSAHGRGALTSVVTVDRPLSAPSPVPTIHRRSVYRNGSTSCHGAPTLQVVPQHRPQGRRAKQRGKKDRPAVLVMNPLPTQLAQPGLAASTVASLIEGAGCRTTLVTASADEAPPQGIDGTPLDLVVLVLDGARGARGGRVSEWAESGWGAPATITASYRAAGLPVVAVGAGAAAGAVAGCVAKGAQPVFGIDQLPDALEEFRSGAAGPPGTGDIADLPPGFLALVGLTASERRVLFHLTEGWAAQDIATELVVSLTTVRSHIRSVLRKLGVRSQLAAVAIANNRGLERVAAGDAS